MDRTNLKEEVIKLRKQGKTYSEIKKILELIPQKALYVIGVKMLNYQKNHKIEFKK